MILRHKSWRAYKESALNDNKRHTYEESHFVWECVECDSIYPQNMWSITYRHGWQAICPTCERVFHVYLGNLCKYPCDRSVEP